MRRQGCIWRTRLDDLTLTVGTRELSGWTSIRVTRGIERMPSDFEIVMTELTRGELAKYPIKPGDACTLKLDDDVVVTGYIDRVSPMIDVGQHSIHVSGRGKCADLIDCSAQWPGGQMSNLTAPEIVRLLVKPYGALDLAREDNPILVSSDLSDPGPLIPQYNICIGETAYTVIERVCRLAGMLVYEDVDGNLFLTHAGTNEAWSGIVEGVNVQRATMNFSQDGCYSEVLGFIQSFDTFQDVGGDIGNLQAKKKDPNVLRHRRLSIIAEAGDSNFKVLEARVQWEIARRFGRANTLRVTVDSWRDLRYDLWAPNTLTTISLPSLGLKEVTWLITEVTYSRDMESGTTAELVLMPAQAFLPQPIVLQPGLADVKQQAPK